MKKFLLFFMTAGILATSAFLASCDGDDEEEFDAPTISLSETDVTAAPGDDVTVAITATTDGGFQSLVVKKMWDDVVQDEETFTALPADYTYTVTDEDAEHVLKLEFTINDAKGKNAKKDLVITVELTPLQMLTKYDWRLNAEIWKEESTNEIDDAYTDDVYRFNVDGTGTHTGTYQKSAGEKLDDFGDAWFNYCYYNLNETTMVLLMSRTGAFTDEVTDTLRITSLKDTELKADVTYYDLNTLPGGEKFGPIEEFEKQFVPVTRGATFDPYAPGAENDAGPGAPCADVVFEND